jgi:hypothetical protein
MYAPSYGFGPGTNSQPFNPNGTPHNPHQQQQQPGQQPQMMYNPQQQYAAIASPQQSPYGGAPGPGMGPNAGGMGMMQNSGLAHMAGGHGMFAPRPRLRLDVLLFIYTCTCYIRPAFSKTCASPPALGTLLASACSKLLDKYGRVSGVAHNQVYQSISTSH